MILYHLNTNIPIDDIKDGFSFNRIENGKIYNSINNIIEIFFDNDKSKIETDIIFFHLKKDDIIAKGTPSESNPKDIFWKISKSILRHLSKSADISTYHPKPIIFISDCKIDIMAENVPLKNDIDARYLYFDSSIWHYFIHFPLNINNDEITNDDIERCLTKDNINQIKDNKTYKAKDTKCIFINKLKEILYEIIQNIEKGLYSKNINKEYIAYQSRLVRNYFSRRKQYGRIKPFTFHSESRMKERIKELLNHEKNKENHSHKEEDVEKKYYYINAIRFLSWKFLLVIEGKNKEGKNKEGKNKEDRIKYLLHKIADEYKDIEKKEVEYKACKKPNTNNSEENKTTPELNPTDNLFYKLDIVHSVKEAKEKLKNEQYDMVLVDYFIENNNGKDEFGTQLVQELENVNCQTKLGPFGKHWIFPVTVFTDAFFNDLREKGLAHINERSFVNTGADPYNTPYLFLYKLVHFMNLQLKQVVVSKEKLHLLFYNYLMNIQDESSSISGLAGDFYGRLMYKFGRKGTIRTDMNQGSLLADSLHRYYLKTDLDNALYQFEHIREFLYLLAFGGRDDQFKLLSELIYINDQVIPQIIHGSDEKKDMDPNNLINTWNKIKEHIYNWKR